LIRTALEKAEVLLSMNNGMAHLDNIWGVGGGNRPVKYLTNKVVVTCGRIHGSAQLRN